MEKWRDSEIVSVSPVRVNESFSGQDDQVSGFELGRIDGLYLKEKDKVVCKLLSVLSERRAANLK